MSRTHTLRLLLAAALAALAAASPSVASAATRTVAVRDDVFSPKAVTLARGDTVRWVWKGRHKHDVASTAFGNSPFKRRGSFAVTFAHPGRYAYYCGLHEGMAGTIVVRR